MLHYNNTVKAFKCKIKGYHLLFMPIIYTKK